MVFDDPNGPEQPYQRLDDFWMPPESVFSGRGKLEHLCLDNNETGLGTAQSALIGDMEPLMHLPLDYRNVGRGSGAVGPVPANNGPARCRGSAQTKAEQSTSCRTTSHRDSSSSGKSQDCPGQRSPATLGPVQTPYGAGLNAGGQETTT